MPDALHKVLVVGTSLGRADGHGDGGDEAGRSRAWCSMMSAKQWIRRVLSAFGGTQEGTTAGSWSDAAAQLRATFSAAWPDLEPARWERIARRSYRENESGMIVPGADPSIGDVVRNSPGAAPDLWPLWKALAGKPILALRGAHSDILSEATLARMQREKAELEAVIVPHRGHAPLLDEPKSLGAIDAFLAAA